MKRDYIPLPERLAAALACLLPQDVRDDLRARKVPAKTVIAMFHNDHLALHSLGGSDAWHNLDPKLVAIHKEKSRQDTSISAKVKRLSKKQEEFQRQLLTPTPKDERPKSKWASRPFSSKSRDRVKKRRDRIK